jgi:hypothetical protein
VLSYSRQIAAAMNGGEAPAPRMTSDQLGKTDAKRGQVPGSTPLVGNGQAPPDLMINQETGQLFTEDGKPYLGKALFLQGDESVVDAQGNKVDLTALERAAGYNPDLLNQTGSTGATAPTGSQTQGAGQPPPEIFTGPQGNIVTADGKPYLGKALFIQEDQTVVDGQGNLVNLAELEQAAGYAPPPPPAPPQFYRGANDQVVDISGQPYLGVTMFIRGDQMVDGNGQQVDFDAVIAQAGYDPNQDPAPEATTDPGQQPDPNAYGPAQTGAPQPEAGKGENKTTGIVRNLLAVAGDYRRWRASQAPADDAATASTTKPARQPRTTKVPPLPKNKGTGKTQATTGTQTTTKTKSTKVNPDSPVPGTRDMRITKAAQQDFRTRKEEILKSYSGQARLPREAQQLTDGQRVRMRNDVRQHQVASKQFKEAYVKVQKWNKRDPGTLTTTEHREMVRDQQTLELAQKQVQKTEVKLNEWNKKIGKKPVDTVVTIQTTKKTQTQTPAAGPRQVSVPNATRKAFQTEWQRFTAENTQTMSVKKTLGAKLTPAQQAKLTNDVQQHQLSKNHLTWKKAEVKTLETQTTKLTAAQQRRLAKNQQLVTLSERNVQKTTAKLQTWETKLGHKISVQNRNGKTEIGLGSKLGTTTKTTKTTSTKGTVKPGTAKTTSRTKTTAAHEPSSSLKPITGRILPGLLAINDAYSLYQGISHWEDEGNTKHYDDAMRVGGAALSTYASVQAFRKGNLGAGIGIHATGVALNLLGQMTNDQD